MNKRESDFFYINYMLGRTQKYRIYTGDIYDIRIYDVISQRWG